MKVGERRGAGTNRPTGGGAVWTDLAVGDDDGSASGYEIFF
jgi:hypothetical protein